MITGNGVTKEHVITLLSVTLFWMVLKLFFEWLHKNITGKIYSLYSIITRNAPGYAISPECIQQNNTQKFFKKTRYRSNNTNHLKSNLGNKSSSSVRYPITRRFLLSPFMFIALYFVIFNINIVSVIFHLFYS